MVIINGIKDKIEEAVGSKYMSDIVIDSYINNEISVMDVITIIINSGINIFDKLDILCKVKEALNEYKENKAENKVEAHEHEIEHNINDINNMIKETTSVINIICGLANDVLVCVSNNNILCSKNIDKLIDVIKTDTIIDKEYNNISVSINSLDSCKTIGSLHMDYDGSVIDYDIPKYNTSCIKNKYIQIDTKLNIGDVVKLIGSDEEYVVVSSNRIESELMTDDLEYSDMIMELVLKNMFNESESYKEQAEKIYKKRIMNIDKTEDNDDIIKFSGIKTHIFNIVKE